MSMKLSFAPAALVLALALSWQGSLLAQEAVLEELYGSGVHKYFSGDYAGADADLTAAVDGGSRDPRVYYFRGLARLATAATRPPTFSAAPTWKPPTARSITP